MNFRQAARSSNKKLFAVALALAAILPATQAASVIKANNAILLNDTASWFSGSLPGTGDVATWDSTVTAANSVGLGAAANWGGILVSNVGGSVTITNDGNVLTVGNFGIDLSTATNNLTLSCLLNISASQTWVVTNGRTLTINGPVTETSAGLGITKNGNGGVTLNGTNSFSGLIMLNAGTLTLGNSNAWPGAASLSFKGGTLAISSGVIVTNLSIVTSNTAASANVSCSGILPNNITINPGSTNVTPQNAIYTSPASGFVQVNLSGSVSSGGYITNYGVLNLTGGSVQSIGTLVGPGSDAAGNLGGIQDNNTNSAGKTLTLGNGSSFAYFKPGAASKATLQIAGNGNAYIKWFGYNDTAGMVLYTNTLNGGTWTINSIGQNNSASHYVGVCNISNSATVNITNNIKYAHGTWNVVSNSLLTFSSPTTADSLTAGHAANNFGLNLAASQNGTIQVFNNGLQLGFGQTTPNTAAETNSVTVGNGGTIYITNNLTLGVVGLNKFLETDVVNLNGGKLIVGGTLAAASGTLAPQTNASPYAVVYPTNIFNWTGGQLTASKITVSNGLAISTITNATPISISVTNPSLIGGNFNSTTLTNNAGILAPGDDGIPGQTVINGHYVQTDGGTVAIDLGGTTRATTFQASTTGFYDYLQVNGNMSVGGSLKVKLVGSYAPAYTDQLNILGASGAGNIISGTFTNLVPGPGLGRVLVEGTTNTYFTVVLNSLTNTIYLINYTNIVTSSLANYPTNITTSVINGGSTLAITWPATHLGWTLQAQTNQINVGLTTNGWVDVAGTAAVTSNNVPIVPSNPTVFYRLRQ